jgi:2-polyprenyl-3-methyl-5-hydroxy-6-metoxy-1,4-benzoquinol methylase
VSDIYTGGTYLDSNPTWHVEDSEWKAGHIADMLARNGISPRSICEVGCGAGEILRQLHDRYDDGTRLVGYEISPQAFELARARSTDRLEFRMGDVLADERGGKYDVLMLIDVIEHVEDYFSLLRGVGPLAQHKLLHIPLDLSAQTVALDRPLRDGRRDFGHIHYFSRTMALKVLEEVGYQVVDWTYTPSAFIRPADKASTKVLNLARKALWAANQEAAVRLLGGWSMLVLAR